MTMMAITGERVSNQIADVAVERLSAGAINRNSDPLNTSLIGNAVGEVLGGVGWMAAGAVFGAALPASIPLIGTAFSLATIFHFASGIGYHRLKENEAAALDLVKRARPAWAVINAFADTALIRGFGKPIKSLADFRNTDFTLPIATSAGVGFASEATRIERDRHSPSEGANGRYIKNAVTRIANTLAGMAVSIVA